MLFRSHADVLDVERRSHVFSSQGTYRAVPEAMEIDMIAQDDPRHQQQRRLVANRFTPRAVREQQSSVIEALIDEIVAAMAAASADGQSIEIVHALAAQLPCRLTALLLGYPEQDWADIQRWSERLMRIDRRYADPAVAEEFFAANFEFAGAFAPIFEARKGCPKIGRAHV